MIIVTRTSEYSGITRSLPLEITKEQILKYSNGAFIQDAFPNLNDDEREFIKSGITSEEWEEIFGDED